MLRNVITHPRWNWGSELLWGMLELAALARSRWTRRISRRA